jgi:hypothetical protein
MQLSAELLTSYFTAVIALCPVVPGLQALRQLPNDFVR